MEWEISGIEVRKIGPSLRQGKSDEIQPLLKKKEKTNQPHNPPLYKGRFGWELFRDEDEKNQKLN